MFLRASTRSLLEKSIGVTVDDLAAMDRETELAFVKAKSGKLPSFSKVVDHRIAARGNHSIAKKKIMTMDDVDQQIMGWKKDERKY